MARLRGKRKQRKFHTLKLQKRKKLITQKMILENDQKPPQSSLLAIENGENLEDYDHRNLSIELPIQSMPASPARTPSHLVIEVYKNHNLKTSSSYSLRKKRSLMMYYWNKKKYETLTRHFNPIPFSPLKGPSNVEDHRTLLKNLGLWDFLHLDFDQRIRADLIKELVVCYNQKKRLYCKSSVDGFPITLSRGALGNALHLPVKSQNLDQNDGDKNGFLMVSEEEALFLEELVWGWLVLQDEGCKVADEVLKFMRFIRENRRLEEVDWAGLIWFMVERELLKGQNLVNCYYASHLQILLKHQRPKLFDNDDFENVGDCSDMEAVVLFDESFKKADCVQVVKDAENFGIEQENENIVVKCYKRRSQYLEKCRKERKLCIVNNVGDARITTSDSEVEELGNQQTSFYLLNGKEGSEDEGERDNVDEGLKMEVSTDLISSGMDDLNREEIDDQQMNLFSNQENGEGKFTLDVSQEGKENAADMLLNQDTHEEGLKIEQSTDLTLGGSDDLNMQETDNQQIDLVSNQENGETEFSKEDSLEEEQYVVAESIVDEQHASLMERGNECSVVNGEEEVEVMQGFVKEVCEEEIGDLLLHIRDNAPLNVQVELSAGVHNISYENALEEGVNQEGMHSSDSLKKGDKNVGLEASNSNEFLGADKDDMQGNLNAEPCKGGSDNVTETKGEDILYFEREKNDKKKCQLNKSNMSEGLVLQHCTAGNVEVPTVHQEVAETNLCHDPPKECTSVQDLYSAHGVQSTCKIEMPFSSPNNSFHQSLIEPFVPEFNMHMSTLMPSVHTEAQERKNIHTSAMFVEHVARQPDIYMNLAGPSTDNSLMREVGILNYGQYEHATATQKLIKSNGADDNESLDFDLCIKQMEVWMSRLKNAANKRAQLDDQINRMLLKKLEEQNKIIEEQNKIIQQYEKSKHEEHQKKQKDIHRYEHEIRLMQNVLCDYRKALKEVNKSFAKYREHCQLPEEPLYRDDPHGGGKVILASELEKVEQERQNSKAIQISIEALMKFLQGWFVKLEGHILEFDHLCDRLEDAEIAVSMLKGNVSKPREIGI